MKNISFLVIFAKRTLVPQLTVITQYSKPFPAPIKKIELSITSSATYFVKLPICLRQAYYLHLSDSYFFRIIEVKMTFFCIFLGNCNEYEKNNQVIVFGLKFCVENI